MKAIMMTGLSIISVILFSFGVLADSSDDLVGPGMPPKTVGPGGTVDPSEGGITPTNYIGTCAEGSSPVLVMRPGDRNYSVECEITPDFPTGG